MKTIKTTIGEGMKLTDSSWKRELWIGDNLAVMRGMNSETVDLIYLDPPFNSKRMYEGNLDPEMGKQSFSDIWGDSDITEDDRRILQNQYPHCADLIELLGKSHGVSWKSYLSFMGIRLMEMHRLLKETGSIYLHCDWHMNAPLRLVMDEIFGADNLRNEITWKRYRGKRSGAKYKYATVTDTILFYCKTKQVEINTPFVPLRADYVQKVYKYDDNDGRGKYRYGGRIRDRKYYLAESKGIPITNLWDDIDELNGTSAEMTGWATQKPVALLERIIKASSNKGDIVFDPFCGCGTACIAATHLGRQWIGIDQHPSADAIMQTRIQKDTKLAPEWDSVKTFDAQTAANLPKRTDETPFKKTAADKRTLYEMQKGKCASGDLCLNGAEAKQINFMDFDRKMPGKRGGGYTWGNVQLLCRTCNGAKGKKTWKVFLDGLKRKKANQYLKELDSPE